MIKFIKKKSKREFMYRYAVTFGETALLHIGGEEYGSGLRKEGFTINELKELADNLGTCAEYISISDVLPEKYREDNEAGILVIRSEDIKDKIIPVSNSLADKLYDEQKNIVYDDMYFDNRKKKNSA